MDDHIHVEVFTRRSTKRLRYDLRWFDRGTGKRRSKCVGTDRKRAVFEAATLETQVNAGTYREVQALSWDAFVEDHVLKVSGNANAENIRQCLTEFGGLCVPRTPSRVTFTLVERYVATLKAQGNAARTINRKVGIIRAAIELPFTAVTRRRTPSRKAVRNGGAGGGNPSRTASYAL